MTQGQSFMVSLLYDEAGYYSAIMAPTGQEVRDGVAKRCARVKLVAATVPFAGSWSHGVPTVDAPPDFQPDLAALECRRAED